MPENPYLASQTRLWRGATGNSPANCRDRVSKTAQACSPCYHERLCGVDLEITNSLPLSIPPLLSRVCALGRETLAVPLIPSHVQPVKHGYRLSSTTCLAFPNSLIIFIDRCAILRFPMSVCP